MTETPPTTEDYGGDGVDYSPHFLHSDDFPSFDAAMTWAKETAIRHGFLLVIASYAPQRDGRRDCYLRCDRRVPKSPRDFSGAVHLNTKRKGVGCKFVIKVAKRKDRSGFFIAVKAGEHGKHNHELVVYSEGHRQISGLSPESKQLVREMSDAQTKPAQIVVALQQKFPADNPTVRHVYNYRDKIRRERLDGRNPAQQVLHEVVQRGYVYWTATDMDGCICQLFCAHPTSLQLFRTWPYVVGMDSTYKTNRYNMPLVEIIGVTPCNNNFLIGYALLQSESSESYEWVLECFRNILGESVQLSAIVTDRDLGLTKALAQKLYGASTSKKGENFKNGMWRLVINAATQDEFDHAWTSLVDSYSWFPAAVSYVRDTWIVHKEKFVRAWTNKVLHFGNTTNCRVESAHASLKEWIWSSTSSLDTIFTRIDKSIEVQLVKIRTSLEYSRGKHGTIFNKMPFQLLNGLVSHHCLQLLLEEDKRRRGLSIDLADRCGCALRTTHRLPCACAIHVHLRLNTGIYLQEVHDFWRQLVIGERVVPGVDEADQDWRHFESLCEELRRRDRSFVRGVSRFIQSQLQPEDSDVQEPPVNSNVRGRPRNSSTCREASAWEYTQQGQGRGRGRSRGRGRGRGRDARGRGSSTSGGSVSSSTGSNVYSGSVSGEMETDEFPYRHLLPAIILDTIVAWNDVLGDGNCGFRCHWRLVRRLIGNEIGANTFYQQVYWNGLNAARQRIEWGGDSCTAEHYMEVPSDLWAIANLYKCAVMLFGVIGPRRSIMPCVTVLPWKVDTTTTQPLPELVIAHLGDYRHYIRLEMQHDFPVPPIIDHWFRVRTPSVHGFEHAYARRRDAWDERVRVQQSQADN
ncbi:Protein FAR1-RELATED SEQUENCE 5 [Bienertia sinuspersici]